MDISCAIGKPFGNKQPSSGYCPPEMAVVLVAATRADGSVDTSKLCEYDKADVAYDMWSLGCVLTCVARLQPLPYGAAANGPTAIAHIDAAVADGKKSPRVRDELSPFAALVRLCVQPAAAKRVSAEDAHAALLLASGASGASPPPSAATSPALPPPL